MEISDTDLRQIVSLFEMSERGSQEDADVPTKNEATNAIAALFRLLAKYGLSIGDIPELQRRQAAKATTAPAAAGRTQGADPNVLELTHLVLQEYIDVQPHEYIGAALWILHAHVFNHFEVTPRLALLSPVRGCGKTNALKLFERLTPNAARYENVTAAVLFRLLDEGGYTFLLDEGDNIGLKMDHVMRRVLNGGYDRGGHTSRMINGIPRDYSTFGPLAIGAIGTLPLPLMQRSIVITMQRSARNDLKTKEQLSTSQERSRLDTVRQLIAAWAKNPTLSKMPKLPKVLRLRTADNWRVLISIADSFGSADWSKAARDAATVFAAGYHDEDAPVSLITDVHTIFIRLRVDRIKSRDLIRELHQLEDGEGIWSAWCGINDDQAPHPISQGEVAALLRRFSRDLRPKPLFDYSRHRGGIAGRGYYKQQFEYWWGKYPPKHSEAAEVRQLRPKKAKAK
jgi:Protein of unknown function (DUF3631)